MAVDGRSTRGRLRDQVQVQVRRKRALRAERIDAILTRRAQGLKVERIAYELRLEVARVEAEIADRRRAGDPRALTDQQAAAASARAVKRARGKPAPEMPPAPGPLPEPEPAPAIAPAPPRRLPRTVCKPTFAPGEEFARDAYIAALEGAAVRRFPSHEHAAACFGHLLDLFVHCPTFYPTYVLRDGGGLATVESTDRLFPRQPRDRSRDWSVRGSPDA